MNQKNFFFALLIAGVAFYGAGCGYTTKTLLPEHVQAVHVSPLTNAINVSQEISDGSRYNAYRPGLEVEVTNAIINRFIFDGHLRVTSEERADAIFSGQVTDFRRDALRYSEDDDIQEYRLSVSITGKLVEVESGNVLWSGGATGDTTFFLSGTRAVSEDEAAGRAIEDLARRVVENTVELW